jgi:hypothetical protein
MTKIQGNLYDIVFDNFKYDKVKLHNKQFYHFYVNTLK